jgi:ribosomal-protein-alanine N-acetyltransferase
MHIPVNEFLFLDRVSKADIPSFVKWCTDEEIYANTISFPKEYDYKAGEVFLDLIEKAEREHGFQQNWAIRLNSSGELIGSIGLLNFSGQPIFKTEIGYWIAAPYRNKGWTTEVVRAFTDFCANHFKLKRIFAHVMPHNPASIRVLEKAGFVKEGLLKNNLVKDGKVMDTWLLARYF